MTAAFRLGKFKSISISLDHAKALSEETTVKHQRFYLHNFLLALCLCSMYIRFYRNKQ